MRTVFQSRDGDPVQIVTPPAPIEIANLDLSEAPEASRIDKAIAAAIEASNRPFDLARDPMLRPTLIKLGENDYLLLLTMHHIASDGWSAGVLMRELSLLYASHETDNGDALRAQALEAAGGPIQPTSPDGNRTRPADLRCRNRSNGGTSGLRVRPRCSRCRLDRPRPPRQTFNGAAETLFISSELVDRLKRIARGERATLFMTLLAAFQTMLHRYGGGDDIVIGIGLAGRTRVETEGLIGLFVNMLAMRGDLSGDPTFRELLRKTRDRSLEDTAHQDVPFDSVVESIHPERNLSYPPIVQVTFQVA